MKLNKLLFFALLALITFGCRTVKQTSTTKAEVKTSANLDIKQSVDNKSTVDSSQETVDNSITNSRISEIVTITNLSKPDSTGKQYPVQTTVINRTIENDKANDVKMSVKVNNTRYTTAILHDKSVYKSDSTAQQINTLTKETKTPAWVYVMVFIIIIVVIAISYYLMKKYKIIDWIISFWKKIK